MKKSDYHTLALASLAIGVINLCAWLLPICGVPLSLIGVTLGIIARDSSQRKLALIGIGFCCLGLVLGVGNALFGATLGATGQLYP